MTTNTCTYTARIDRVTGMEPHRARDWLVSHQTNVAQWLDASRPQNLVLRLCQESNYDSAIFGLINTWLADIRARSSNINIFVICNSWFRSFVKPQSMPDVTDIMFVDYYLLWVYHILEVLQAGSTAGAWHAQNHRVLLLTGKAYKLHRIRLLYKALKSNLAAQLNWSFWARDDMETEHCRKFMPELDDHEWNWLMNQQRYYQGNLSPWGMPSDATMFDTAAFQIISETDFDRPWQHPWITEKTWMSIINQRPFVMASEYKTLTHLESMGFSTFREFLPIPNYDDPDSDHFLMHGVLSKDHGPFVPAEHRHYWRDFYQSIRDAQWPDIDDLRGVDSIDPILRDEILAVYRPPIFAIDELRLEAIMFNAEFWQQNIGRFESAVKEHTEHNHARLLNLGRENYHRFRQFMQQHQLDCTIDWLLDLEKLDINKGTT